MRKDFKTGMLLGLGLAVAAVFWLSSQDRFSIQSQALQSIDSETSEQSSMNEARYNAPLPGSVSGSNQGRESQNDNVYEEPFNSSNIDTQQRIHVVSQGETLSSISSLYYGTSTKVNKIFEANRDKLKNPNDIMTGMLLVIPDQ
ncbi:MAG: LysM peptidoglycan-binding domain-containing protein [Planctomycetota bacterium]|jgi:nucleoid-associated protein YgaU